MNLDFHISELLYRFPCVTVPGFGAFITENVSAQISGSAASFIPPRKKITFNSNIKNNDGLLVNHVATFYSIPFEKATEKIENVVANWLFELQNQREIDLDKIGVFSPSLQNKFTFTPNEETNYLTSSFGLMPFITPEISRLVKEVAIPKLETVSTTEETEEVSDKKYQYEAPDFSFIKYAAAVVVFCSAGLFGYKMYYDNQIEQQTLYVQKEVQKQVENTIQNATFSLDFELPKVTIQDAEVNKPYHLIFGAFRNPSNAEKALKNLKEKGFEAKVLPVNKYDLIPVAYGSYATQEEADQVKKEINQTSKNQVWILID